VLVDLQNYFCGKKILVICQIFFGYENRIVKRINELGASALWVDIRPGNSFLVKSFLRYLPFLFKNKLKKYYKKK